MKVERAMVLVASVGLLVASAVTSCGGRSSTADTADAQNEADADVSDAAVDAGSRCDPTAPFGTPASVPGLAGYVLQDRPLRITLTEDELDALLTTGGSVVELSRSSVETAFGNPIERTELKSGQVQLVPSNTALTLSSDGLRAAIGGHSVDGGHSAVARASRSARGEPFAILAPTTWSDEAVDGLFFVPTAEDAVYGTTVSQGIFRQSASRGLQLLPYLGEGAPTSPAINRAETELYLRPNVYAGIIRTTRSDINQLWGPALPASDLSADPDRFVAWLSPDGCRAYLGSAVGRELLVAQRGGTQVPVADADIGDTAADADAEAGVGQCANWIDHTNIDEVQLTWDFSIAMNPDRCSIIKAGARVRWTGNFDVHPLEPFGGDTPSPISNGFGADAGLPDAGGPSIVVAFPGAGTFGFDCVNHPFKMFGAVKVVP